MDITNTPTYLQGPDCPIFGVLSSPADGKARGAVLICASVGKELGHTTRGVKRLAERLAASGFAVLRFDYAGLGESGGDQRDPDARDRWLRSVNAAADAARALGVGEPIVIGHRMGALLASHAPNLIAAAPALVLWDPVLRARHFLRAQKTMYAMMSQQHPDLEPVTPLQSRRDEVQFAGLTLHPDAVAALNPMKLCTEALGGKQTTHRTLALLSETPGSAEIATAIADGGGVAIGLGDQSEFLDPVFPETIRFPGEIEVIADWLDSRVTCPPEPISFTPTPHAVVSTTNDGHPIETAVRVGNDGSMVWDTAIAGTHDLAEKIVVTHSIAHDPRTGPARSFVELAIDVASRGGRGFRFDRPGVGEAGITDPSDTYIRLYDNDYRDAGLAALQSLSVPENAQIAHVGICLGAWMSAHAAVDAGVNPPGLRARTTAVLVNPLRWRLDPLPSEQRATEVTDNSPRLATRVAAAVTGKIPPEVHTRMPARLYTLICRWLLHRRPEKFVRSVLAADGGISIVLGPSDYGFFERMDGPEALRRKGLQIPVTVTTGGDHAGYDAEIREATARACLAALHLADVEAVVTPAGASHDLDAAI